MKKYDIKEFAVIPPPYGGVSVFLARLVRQLNEDGIKAGAFYSSDNKDTDVLNSPLYDELKWSNNMPVLLRGIYRIKRMVKATANYRIIHIHGHEDMILAAIAHFIVRQKIVITIHNSMVCETFSRFSSLKRFAYRYLAKEDVQWIAVSEQTKEKMEKLSVHFKRSIEVLPAYIPDLTEDQQLSFSLSHYIEKHKKNVAFYGRSFMLYQNQDVYGFRTAIHLYSRIVNAVDYPLGFILCISDISDDESINDLKKYAGELGVGNLIFWQLGPIKGIRALWSTIDLYVRPTYTDGDSVSIRDALAEGASVVASDVCPRPEGVMKYQYGDDDEFLMKCIEALNIERKHTVENNTYYLRMKDIYLSLL